MRHAVPPRPRGRPVYRSRIRAAVLLPAALLGCVAPAALAAPWPGDGWAPWIVLGAIAAFVLGVIVRMVLAARFPKGYRRWAASRRDAFAERNEAWDRADDEFRR